MRVLLAIALLSPLPASAAITSRLAKLPRPQRSWFCTASGYDYNGQMHSVSGELRPSRDEAARDAVRNCQGLFTVCQLATCVQE